MSDLEPSIEQWGREHYPRLMENTKLVEALYRRKVLNKPTLVGQTMAYPLEKVASLKADKAVSVIVTKVESKVTERQLCKVCGKGPKNCKDAQPTEKVPFYVVNMLAGDESGMTKFQHLTSNKDVVDMLEGGEVFVFTGSYKVHEKYGNEFDVRSGASLSDEQKEAWDKLDDYYSIKGGEGGISEEEFSKVLDGKQELLAPVLERVYISHQDGRVRY